MELMDTVNLMNSDDYKERFKAEYYQTETRFNKLHDIIVKYHTKTLDFDLSSNIEILEKQATAMANYLKCLKVRARIEKINI